MVGSLSKGASKTWTRQGMCSYQTGCQPPPICANEVIRQYKERATHAVELGNPIIYGGNSVVGSLSVGASETRT
jgi:Ni,Fe-hydrogenase I small subunit